MYSLAFSSVSPGGSHAIFATGSDVRVIDLTTLTTSLLVVGASAASLAFDSRTGNFAMCSQEGSQVGSWVGR